MSGFVTRRPPTFASSEAERLHRKQRLAAGFRLLGRMGFGEGIAGHASARDPILEGHYSVNAYGQSFRQVKVSDLCLQVGSARLGWFSFQPLYDWIVAQEPNLLD